MRLLSEEQYGYRKRPRGGRLIWPRTGTTLKSLLIDPSFFDFEIPLLFSKSPIAPNKILRTV